MKKIIFFMTIFVFAGTLFFSQTAEENNAAKTAEKDSVLSDSPAQAQFSSPKVGKNAVPDYSEVLPIRQTSELVPRLPDASAGETSLFEEKVTSNAVEKSVYAEGLAGIGYPGFFVGNFSVYNQTGPNPFKISFGHETMNGYARNSRSSVFFDKNTSVSAEKTFSFGKGKFVASGLYKSLNDGLQNQNENMSDMTRELMKTCEVFSMNLPKGFSFAGVVEGSWYRRYGTVVGTPLPPIPDYAKNISVVALSPNAKLDFKYKDFFIGFDSKYSLSLDMINSFGERFSNSGRFSLDSGYENDFVKATGKVGLVVGNDIGGNPVLVPFSVGADFTIPVPFSSRNVKLSVSGGMDSYSPEIHALEMKNAFSVLGKIPGESTDWYGKLDFSLPVKEFLSFRLFTEIRKTAFGNGTLTADYDNDSSRVAGLYVYSKKDMFQFNTLASASYKTKVGIFGAEWESAWASRPANIHFQKLQATYSYQSRTAFFTFDALLGFYPGDKDMIPFFDFEAGFKVSSAVRLALAGDDIVKLIMGKPRLYAGSYISRSGGISLLAKFVF